MAENRCVAGAKGYKRLCDVIVVAPIVHVDGDYLERYHVIFTNRTRGFLGASPFIALTSNCTTLYPKIRAIALPLALNSAFTRLLTFPLTTHRHWQRSTRSRCAHMMLSHPPWVFVYKYIPYSTYYKPMMYYNPTFLYSSKFLYRYRTPIDGIFVYKPLMYYKPTLFRGDVWEIAHGLLIHTILY